MTITVAGVNKAEIPIHVSLHSSISFTWTRYIGRFEQKYDNHCTDKENPMKDDTKQTGNGVFVGNL